MNTRLEIAYLHRALGTTMIYVTHDQTEAMTLADKTGVMNGGHIQQADASRVLHNDPVNLFVAGFSGSPRMNSITGTAAQAEGTATIGVWPEHRAVTDDAPRWRGVVRPLEYLGSDTFLFVKGDGDTELCVRVDSAAPHAIGDAVGLPLVPGKLLRFDAAGGPIRGSGIHESGADPDGRGSYAVA